MSGLFALDLKTLIAVACVVGAIQVAVHILRRAVDLWFDTVGRSSDMDQHAVAALRLASKEHPPYVGFDPPEVAPEDEPNWPSKAPHDSGVRHLFTLVDQPKVFGGNPATFDLTGLTPSSGVLLTTPPETAAETSGRHALTESMPAVVDEAPAEEAAVHG